MSASKSEAEKKLKELKHSCQSPPPSPTTQKEADTSYTTTPTNIDSVDVLTWKYVVKTKNSTKVSKLSIIDVDSDIALMVKNEMFSRVLQQCNAPIGYTYNDLSLCDTANKYRAK